MIQCPKCGTQNTSSTHFCRECSHDLSQYIICPGCKKLIEADSDFCCYCTYDIKNPPNPAPPVSIEKKDEGTNWGEYYRYAAIGVELLKKMGVI